MAKLIALNGIGINWKTTIVNQLPNLAHIPQTNREYFESHPEDGFTPDKYEIIKYFMGKFTEFMNASNAEVFITERTPLSYFCYDAAIHGKPDYEYLTYVMDYQDYFMSFFDEVEYLSIMNLDLLWLGNYMSTLRAKDPTNPHLGIYKSRGYYTLLQDRYMKAFLNEVPHDYIAQVTDARLFLTELSHLNSLEGLIQLIDRWQNP